MAQFLAAIHGQRGQATRLGSSKSGIHVSANGWNAGVTVEGAVESISVDPNFEADVFTVYATRGSSPRDGRVKIAEVQQSQHSVIVRVYGEDGQPIEYRTLLS